MNQVFSQTEEGMKKVVERIRSEFSSLRTGRANISLLDNVRVDYYGSQMSLQQIASLSTPDARTIEIRPWDMGALSAIEKSIQASDLGLTPNNDGKIIRLNIPALTEDRRKEIVKTVKKIAEEYRVQVRNERRQGMETLKKMEKEKKISQDELSGAETRIQKLTDSYIAKVDEVLSRKEQEVMEV